MTNSSVTPLRCKMFGHDFEYVTDASGNRIRKECQRCGLDWEDAV